MVGKVTPNTMMSASRLPALMGISKYRSPNDELLATIDALRGIEPAEPENQEAMRWGDKLEPEILKETCLRLGICNLDLDHQQAYFHESWPLACSLDGSSDGRGLVVFNSPDQGVYTLDKDMVVLEGMGVLEAKLTAMDAEEVPPLWRGPVQLQAQMACTGAKWGILATLYRGTKLRIFIFEPHQPTLDAIEAAVLDFQRRIDIWKNDGVIEYYPPLDSKDADRAWGQVAEEVEPIHLDTEAEALCKMIGTAKSQISGYEQQIADCEAKLKNLMREFPRARAGSFDIKWPMRHYKAQPERVVPAKEAYSVRQSTLTIKEISNA